MNLNCIILVQASIFSISLEQARMRIQSSLLHLFCMILLLCGGMKVFPQTILQPHDSISSDPTTFDAKFPASLEPVTIRSSGSQMNGLIYLAQGAGPHPTVILLHGFPGTELNLDLAQVIRRAGWNVLVFHYRGAWGSEGLFSFTNMLEDVPTAISFLRTATVAKRYRIDSKQIVLIGHSMGGFAAIMSSLHDKNIRSVASISGWNLGLSGELASNNQQQYKKMVREWQDELTPLKFASAELLADDLVKHRAEWQLVNYAPELSQKSLLLVAARRDIFVQNHVPVVEALKSIQANNFTEVILESDHSYSDHRIALANVIVSWLEKQRQ